MGSFETMSDLAATGRLEGRRVRLLEDISFYHGGKPLVPAGTVGVVLGVNAHEPKGLFRWTIEDRPEGNPWREVASEGPLRTVELVD